MNMKATRKTILGTTLVNAALMLGGTPLTRAQQSTAETIVKTVHQDVIVASVTELSVDDGVVLLTDGGKTLKIPARDLVRLTCAPSVDPRPSNATKVTLHGGDELFGMLSSGNRERLVLESNDLGKLELPLDVVTGIDLPRAATPAFAEAITWLDRARLPQQDRVLLANGDLASTILFASFALFSVINIITVNQRGDKETPAPVSRLWDVGVVVIGLSVYGLIYYFHGWLTGMPLR